MCQAVKHIYYLFINFLLAFFFFLGGGVQKFNVFIVELLQIKFDTKSVEYSTYM